MTPVEARELVAYFERLLGGSFTQHTVATRDQVLASLRDDLTDLQVDTTDPAQMRGVFAGALCAVGSMSGQPVSGVSLNRLTALLRAFADWQTGGVMVLPELPRRSRWRWLFAVLAAVSWTAAGVWEWLAWTDQLPDRWWMALCGFALGAWLYYPTKWVLRAWWPR